MVSGKPDSFWLIPSFVPEIPGSSPRVLAPEGGRHGVGVGVDGERRGPLTATPIRPSDSARLIVRATLPL